MKRFVLCSLIGFLSSIAQASYTMCANSELYYSSTHVDMGNQPPPGQKIGSLTIVFKGNTLVNEVFESGQGGYSNNDYSVELGAPRQILEETGNSILGTKTYKTRAKLFQVDPVNPGSQKIVASQNVICVESWAKVP